MTACAQHLVDRLHAVEEPVHLVGVEGLVETGRPREVPGVDEDVADAERGDRVLDL